MGRKPLDASDETVRVTLRLTATQAATLDERRGTRSRSAYLRSLLDAKKTDTPQTIAEKLRPITEAARQMGGVKHYHRFEKTDQVHHYERGTPVYVRRCSCGETA